jgi:membrane-associated phospholipid phosphatase
MFALCLTYYAHYLMFILLPAHSPRYFIPGLREALPGYLWSAILKILVEGNAYPGASFPSSHVAAACIVFMAYPRLGRFKTPVLILTLLLFAGTVWGRYHYISDLAAGLAMGWFFLKISPRVEAVFQGWANTLGAATRPGAGR